MEREVEMGTEIMEWVGRDLRELSATPAMQGHPPLAQVTPSPMSSLALGAARDRNSISFFHKNAVKSGRNSAIQMHFCIFGKQGSTQVPP